MQVFSSVGETTNIQKHVYYYHVFCKLHNWLLVHSWPHLILQLGFFTWDITPYFLQTYIQLINVGNIMCNADSYRHRECMWLCVRCMEQAMWLKLHGSIDFHSMFIYVSAFRMIYFIRTCLFYLSICMTAEIEYSN